MSALRVVRPEEVPEYQCLLCGEEAETYIDLCDRCAAAFSAAADQVADAIRATGRRGLAAVQVPGQLELGDRP